MKLLTKELLEKVKKQLLNERTTKLGWTLPKWVAEELFAHIDSLEQLKSKVISQVITEARISLLEEEIKILRNGVGWARAQADVKNLRNCLEIAIEKADKLTEKSNEQIS